MTRRWITRSLALIPLFLLLTIWVASYFYDAEVIYDRTDRVHSVCPVYLAGFGGGNLVCIRFMLFRENPGTAAPGWTIWRHPYWYTPSQVNFFEDPFTGSFPRRRRFYLFGFGYVWDFGGENRGVCIPCWFLALLGLAPPWLVWRKTRPTPKGFPVEANQRNVVQARAT